MRISLEAVFLSSLLALLCGCGYHFEKTDEAATLSIPYIEGDRDGQFTTELIRQITTSGRFSYLREGGAYILKVVIVSDNNDRIGYAFDRKGKSGHRTKNLVPNEGRRTMTVEISLIEEPSGEQILSPTLVRASVDYDYVGGHSIRNLSFKTPSGHRETVSSFSLGQLDSVEGAQDDALFPLYRVLSQKIIDGIIEGL